MGLYLHDTASFFSGAYGSSREYFTPPRNTDVPTGSDAPVAAFHDIVIPPVCSRLSSSTAESYTDVRLWMNPDTALMSLHWG